MRNSPAWLALVLLVSSVPGVSLADPDLEKGKQVYTIYCVTCHGESGDGKGPVGLSLNPPPRDFTKAEWKFGGSPQQLFEVVSDGAAVKGGSPLMAPWGAVLPEADRHAVVKYVISLKRTRQAAQNAP
jgi:mono/diheme cytochrome c family protein